MNKKQSTVRKATARKEAGEEKRHTRKDTTRGPARGSVTSPPWEAEKRPVVALVGRPNVGKSTLFNRIAGGRAAIVEDRPGTTRDRRYANAEWDGRHFIICDTGGFEPDPDQPILQEMRRQTQLAIEEADVVVFVTDAKAGLNPSDTEIAQHLRRTKKPVIVAVNKVDGQKQEALAMELYGLGLGELRMMSAAHGIGVNTLLDDVLSRLPPPPPRNVEADVEVDVREEAAAALEAELGEDDVDNAEIDNSVSYEGDVYDPEEYSSDSYDDGAAHPEVAAEAAKELDPRARPSDEIEPEPGIFREPKPDDGVTRIAVIGRPNAGKSTLINRLLGEERLLTFHEAGTTRDAIDTWLERGKSRYLLIDTAGIRRQRSVHDPLEKICISRALDAVDRADVAWLLIDAIAGITEQDAKVASFAHEKGKGIVLVLNKWDLTAPGPKVAQRLREEIERKLTYLKYAPIVTVSARTGSHIDKLLAVSDKVAADRKGRIPTGKLNRFFRDVLERHPPPTQSGRLVKLLYITQAATRPPVFLVSVNYPKSVHFSYQRYVVNQLRKAFGFEGVPLRVFYRKRNRN